jgi:hypothetical protein
MGIRFALREAGEGKVPCFRVSVFLELRGKDAMGMKLVEYLRTLSVDQLEELMIDQKVTGTNLVMCQAVINEKVGAQVWGVPDTSTFEGPGVEDAMSLPMTRDYRGLSMPYPWSLLYFMVLYLERRFRKWRLWVEWKAPRKRTEVS